MYHSCFEPSFSLFELLIGIVDCFTCSTNCDLIHIYCFILFLFWPLSIGLRLFYRRKWTFIAEKHLCGRVKTRTALRTSWTTTYGPTHRNNCVAQVQSATAPSQVMHFNKIGTSDRYRVYILQSHAKRF